MSKSRIKKYHHNRNYCELDGQPCIHCKKCDHLPACSSNRLSNFLIALVAICVIIFVLNPILMMGMEKQNADIADDTIKMDEDRDLGINNDGVSDFNNYHGLGQESVGDNYNSMG